QVDTNPLRGTAIRKPPPDPALADAPQARSEIRIHATGAFRLPAPLAEGVRGTRCFRTRVAGLIVCSSPLPRRDPRSETGLAEISPRPAPPDRRACRLETSRRTAQPRVRPSLASTPGSSIGDRCRHRWLLSCVPAGTPLLARGISS